MFDYISDKKTYTEFKKLLEEETSQDFCIGMEANEEIGFIPYKTLIFPDTGIITVYMKHNEKRILKISKYYPDSKTVFHMMLNEDDINEVVNQYIELNPDK